MKRHSLTRYAWLSIAAAIITITLKVIAYLLTGSIGLLSDAIESIVNLLGASIALAMLTIAERPADKDHLYGHSKAEYFSSGAEGVLILIASFSIGYTAIDRLINPSPLEQAGTGLIVSAFASLINLAVARILFKVAKKSDSITLEADARHLMTDVWTSVGVIGGIGVVAFSGWLILDPLVALAVGANIVWTGIQLVRRSVAGLMDSALPAEDQKTIEKILDMYKVQGVHYHTLLTRQAASRRFISVHILVPGVWPVQKAHQLINTLESEMRRGLPGVSVITHLEPAENPGSHPDSELD
jgi:cation diffusion facilitator family transporter